METLAREEDDVSIARQQIPNQEEFLARATGLSIEERQFLLQEMSLKYQRLFVENDLFAVATAISNGSAQQVLDDIWLARPAGAFIYAAVEDGQIRSFKTLKEVVAMSLRQTPRSRVVAI